MASAKHVLEYRKNAVNGASPLQLVVMLYDGALRFMEAGKAAMSKGDLQRQNDNLQRAQQIVIELMSTLDVERGGEIASNLMSLYRYVLEQLVMANVLDQPEPIDRSIRTMSELRESWFKLASGNAEPIEADLAA